MIKRNVDLQDAKRWRAEYNAAVEALNPYLDDKLEPRTLLSPQCPRLELTTQQAMQLVAEFERLSGAGIVWNSPTAP